MKRYAARSCVTNSRNVAHVQELAELHAHLRNLTDLSEQMQQQIGYINDTLTQWLRLEGVCRSFR